LATFSHTFKHTFEKHTEYYLVSIFQTGLWTSGPNGDTFCCQLMKRYPGVNTCLAQVYRKNIPFWFASNGAINLSRLPFVCHWER